MPARSPEPAKRCDRPQSFKRVGRGPAPRADVGEHFDRGGKPRAGGHYGSPSMIRTMKISHMIASTSAPMPKNGAAQLEIVAGDVDIGVGEPRQHENPGQHHEQEIGVLGDDREDGQHIEQHRQLELAGERVADLHRAPRPVRLAQIDVLGADLAAAEAPARAARQARSPARRSSAPARTTARGSWESSWENPSGMAWRRVPSIYVVIESYLEKQPVHGCPPRPAATRTSILPKFSPAQQPDQRARRVLEAVDDVLAVLDAAFARAMPTRRAGNRRGAPRSRRR